MNNIDLYMINVNTLRPLKGCYPFLMFSRLYALENAVKCTSDDGDLYAAAAENGGKYAVMLTHYHPDPAFADEKTVTLHLENAPDGDWTAEFLDHERTMEKQTVSVQGGELTVTVPHDCVMLMTK